MWLHSKLIAEPDFHARGHVCVCRGGGGKGGPSAWDWGARDGGWGWVVITTHHSRSVGFLSPRFISLSRSENKSRQHDDQRVVITPSVRPLPPTLNSTAYQPSVTLHPPPPHPHPFSSPPPLSTPTLTPPHTTTLFGQRRSAMHHAVSRCRLPLPVCCVGSCSAHACISVLALWFLSSWRRHLHRRSGCCVCGGLSVNVSRTFVMWLWLACTHSCGVAVGGVLQPC